LVSTGRRAGIAGSAAGAAALPAMAQCRLLAVMGIVRLCYFNIRRVSDKGRVRVSVRSRSRSRDVAKADRATPTLAGRHAGADRHRNNFNMLRLIAAGLVILSHGVELPTGLASRDWMLQATGRSFAWYGVNIFFVISGYLVYLSWQRRPSIVAFVWARFLRIMPGLFCMLVVSVLILGVAFSSLAFIDFLIHPQTRVYFFGSLSILLVKYELPGVFTGNPLSAVNGSLWTLRYEILCYAGVALMGVAHLLADRRKSIAVLMVCVAGEIGILVGFEILGLARDGSRLGMLYELARLGMCFHLGGLYAQFDDRIRLRVDVAVAGVVLTVLLIGTPLFVPMANLTVAYAAFWFALVPSGRWIAWMRTAPDYSYGTYIYAFPVQQALIASIPGVSSVTVILGGFAVTLIFAALSWHLVERPMLQLKNVRFLAARRKLPASM
jgi:peptidoglycan/LPS O-acetylase OafA/YrhL